MHDAAEEERDKVEEMQVPKSPMPGNSTVNMASVVPDSRIVAVTSTNKQSSAGVSSNQTVSGMPAPPEMSEPTMFVKGPAGSKGSASRTVKRE